MSQIFLGPVMKQVNPSFFLPPFALYDASYLYVGNAATFVGISFNPWSGIAEEVAELRFPVSGGSNAGVAITTLPLQFRSAPAGNDWSVRRIVDSGPHFISEATNGPGGAIGDWYDSSTRRRWLINRSVNPSFRVNTSTYELALTADTNTVLARATITFTFDRT